MGRHKVLPTVKVPHSRFIVSTNDASQDVWIESVAAKTAYNKGEIAWDTTNGAYCSIHGNGQLPPGTLKWHRYRGRDVMQG